MTSPRLPQATLPAADPPGPAGDRSPSTPGARWRRGAQWGLFFAALVALVLVDPFETPSGGTSTRRGALLVAGAIAAFYTALLFTAVWLTERSPVGGERSARNVAVHAGAALAFGVASAVLDRLLTLRDTDLTGLTLFTYLAGQAGLYALAAGAAHAAEYGRRSRRAEVAELGLRAELAEAGRQRAEAELRALRVELNPQVLGNALDSAAALVRPDPLSAERMLASVGQAMRAVMAERPPHEVTLEDELEGLESFLAIERARLAGRLAVTWDIDPGALDARVPDMILQPLVESAVRPRSIGQRDGQLTVAAYRVRRGDGDEEHLEVRVVHEVGELSADELERVAAGANGASLANARARLAQLYGDRGAITLEPDPGRGVVARLMIPWLEALESAATPGDAPPPGAAEAPFAGAVNGVPDETDDGSPARNPVGAGRAPPRARRAAVALAWFLGVWGFSASVTHDSPHGAPPSAGAALLNGLLSALFWTGVLYAAVRFTRSHPVRGSRARRSLTWHAGVALVVALVGAVRTALDWQLVGPPPGAVLPHLVVALVGRTVIYALLVAAVHAVRYARHYRRSEAAGLRLRAALAEAGQRQAEAEVRALRAELNPHFVGNALHAAAALVRPDPAAAERVLVQLGELLRGAAAGVSSPELTLREELAGLEPFLAIEQAQLGGRLAVTYDVAPEALDVCVPDMILQPLVENAVRHGIAVRGAASGGRLAIAARHAGARGEWLELTVTDDGVGPPAAARVARSGAGGVGLANVRDRLAKLYGPDASVELAPGPGGVGAVARLRLPWRPDAHRDAQAPT